MRGSPSALLLGDAELDRVERLLTELQVDYERVRGPRATMQLPGPTRLLVVAGSCAAKLPTLLAADAAGEGPVRVCLHSQDFLPLRERLRERGFHYLVQSALDDASLRVLLTQLLHPGASQRASDRLPLGGMVEYRSGSASGNAKLGDLSLTCCRILGAEGLRLDDLVTLVLPASLGGGEPLVLPGSVIRSDRAERAGGTQGLATVVRFVALETDARERLARLVRGELMGARVTPLAARESAVAPDGTRPPAAASQSPRDRRREVRHPYQGRVEVLELPGGGEGALGRDLSLDGICVTGRQRLKPGMKVTLALYGGADVDPTVVEAEVIRSGESGSALVFSRLTEVQQDRLAALIAGQPAVEALGADEGATPRVVPTRILHRG